ncbi:uncharacterized protein [Diadema antillarum]|uniref:uncharacterized protein n=1 Tax=Diadema antillarum TaxID=105358 RepID=UPI003A89904A
MAHNFEKAVSLISKDPDERDDREVDLLIPWFQNMSGLFKAQKTDVMKDIVRNCDFLSVPADTVIIKQGTKGDCFYIILTGSVSVYINQALEEQDNVPKHSTSSTRRRGGPHTPGHQSRQSIRHSRPPSSRKSPKAFSPKPENGLHPSREHSVAGVTERIDSLTSGTKSATCEDEASLTADDASGNKTGSKRGESPTRVNIIVEDFSSDSQVDSGRSSGGMTLDENENHIYDGDDSDEEDVDRVDPGDEGGNNSADDFDSDFDYSSDEGDDDVLEQTMSTTKLDRAAFGVHIRELGAGKCFGELALVQTNLVRTASILTNQETNLIVIDRELYNRSLKAAQQHEFNLKKNFVNSFPLFRNWTPRQRSVMTMSLTRCQYQYGNTMVKQGSPVRGLLFLTQGSAKVSTDTVQHIRQYPNLCTEKDLQFAKDVNTGRGTRTLHPGSTSFAAAVGARRGVQHWIRRKETYAQAEKHLNYKNTNMCVIGVGDYIGDFEVLLRLPTYSCSVMCLESVDAFELDLNNFERQIVKKSPTSYAALKETAMTKLQARVNRLNRDEQLYMPVLEVMLHRLQDMNNPNGWRQKNRPRQSISTLDIGPDDIGRPGAPWRDYREKQRQFLRRRQREKRLEEMRNVQMAHAASLGLQLERQNRPPANANVGQPILGKTDDAIERRAGELFPDVPHNVKLRVDPKTGLIRATEVRVQRSLIYNNGNRSGVMTRPFDKGRPTAPRSNRELISAFAEESRSDTSTDKSSDSGQSMSKLNIRELRNFSLKSRMLYQPSLANGATKSSVVSSAVARPERPRSSSSSSSQSCSRRVTNHSSRPASRSAESVRPYSFSI